MSDKKKPATPDPDERLAKEVSRAHESYSCVVFREHGPSVTARVYVRDGALPKVHRAQIVITVESDEEVVDALVTLVREISLAERHPL